MNAATISAPPLSKKKIEDIAWTVRNIYGKIHNPNSLYFPIVPFIELLGALPDDTLNYDVAEDESMGDHYAHYDPIKNTLSIKSSVYLGALQENGRDRFTLAHELGHYFLHRNAVQFARAESGGIPKYCEPEWQANTFASMLLIPPRLIVGMSVEEVMFHTHTSRQAATIAVSRVARR